MGGTSSKETTQKSQTEPWAEAKPVLTGILGQIGNQLGHVGLTDTENAAFNTLQQSAQAGNPYAPNIARLTTDLFAGGPDRSGAVSGAYDDYRYSLTPFARGDYVNPNANPALQPYLDTIQNDVSNSVNSMFAGAGRDLSPAHVQALSRGLTQGTAPVMLDAYNQALAGQRSAIDQLYGAGGQTAGLLSGLDRTALGNRQAGIAAANAALQAQNYGPNAELLTEAQKRSITTSLLAQLAGIATPIAALGNQSSGQSTVTSNASPMELALGYSQAFKNLLPIFGAFGGGGGESSGGSK
jgi:hypothetical protein